MKIIATKLNIVRLDLDLDESDAENLKTVQAMLSKAIEIGGKACIGGVGDFGPITNVEWRPSGDYYQNGVPSWVAVMLTIAD